MQGQPRLVVAHGNGSQPYVRLLEVEPDLGLGIDRGQFEAARRWTVARVLTLEPGPWEVPARNDEDWRQPVAGLLMSGALARESLLGDSPALQLLTPGDVVPLVQPSDDLQQYVCSAVSRARIAMFDERVIGAMQRWPWLAARITDRSACWADRALASQAISQLRRTDHRIVAVLWQLADSCGRVTLDGVLVGVELSHSALGALVGAARPTVSLALAGLAEEGLVRAVPGGWLLRFESRELVAGLDAVDVPRRRLAGSLALHLEGDAETPTVDFDAVYDRLQAVRAAVQATRREAADTRRASQRRRAEMASSRVAVSESREASQRERLLRSAGELDGHANRLRLAPVDVEGDGVPGALGAGESAE